jgi:hypothetical protein
MIKIKNMKMKLTVIICMFFVIHVRNTFVVEEKFKFCDLMGKTPVRIDTKKSCLKPENTMSPFEKNKLQHACTAYKATPSKYNWLSLFNHDSFISNLVPD